MVPVFTVPYFVIKKIIDKVSRPIIYFGPGVIYRPQERTLGVVYRDIKSLQNFVAFDVINFSIFEIIYYFNSNYARIMERFDKRYGSISI